MVYIEPFFEIYECKWSFGGVNYQFRLFQSTKWVTFQNICAVIGEWSRNYQKGLHTDLYSAAKHIQIAGSYYIPLPRNTPGIAVKRRIQGIAFKVQKHLISILCQLFCV